MTILMGFLSGCSLLEMSVRDLNGWDLSACVDGYKTCYELLTDNEEKILGGKKAIDLILDNLRNTDTSDPESN